MNQNQIDGGAAIGVETGQRPAMHVLNLTPGAYPAPALFPAILALGGGENEVKSTQFKQGIVNITEGRTPQGGRSYWQLRYIDPDTGREIKRRVSGLELDEVKAMAEHLTRRAYQGKGYLAGQHKAPGIEDGILEAIRLSRARDYVKANMIQRAKPFLTFMAEVYPAVQTWADLRPGMAEAYLRRCEAQGLAYDTICDRLKPVKAAWRRVYADYPDLVKAPASLKLEAPPRREIVCLTADEVKSLLDWLKAHAPDIWPMACLQALAGLRVLEAAALRVQDVDLKAGTITITDTGYHRPKTRDSYRTIPVCDEVIEALKAALARQKKVRPATGEIFTNQSGNLWVKDALTLRWRRTLAHVAAEPKVIRRERTGKRLTLNKHGLNMPRLAAIPCRKLRAAFATMAGRLGAQVRLLKAYLGHSSGDMLGGHYRRIDLDELRTVSSLMNGWRKVEKAAECRKESGNIPSINIAEC